MAAAIDNTKLTAAVCKFGLEKEKFAITRTTNPTMAEIKFSFGRLAARSPQAATKLIPKHGIDHPNVAVIVFFPFKCFSK